MDRQRPNIHLMSDEKELLPAGVLREKCARMYAVCCGSLLRFSKNEFSAGNGVTGPISRSAAVSWQRHHSLEYTLSNVKPRDRSAAPMRRA